MHNFQNLIMIGLINEHPVILTNQKLCLKAGLVKVQQISGAKKHIDFAEASCMR